MTVPTDPALLAAYKAGEIDYATFQARVAEAQRKADLAAKQKALEAATNVSPTLVASELALARQSYLNLQAEARRREAERKQRQQEAAELKRRQREIDAARAKKRKTAAELAARQKALEAEKARKAQEQYERELMQQKLVREQEARTNELLEQARQAMISETGRVVAAEQYGTVAAGALQQARLERAAKTGETITVDIGGEYKTIPPEEAIAFAVATGSQVAYTSEPPAPPPSKQPEWPGGELVGIGPVVTAPPPPAPAPAEHVVVSTEATTDNDGAYTPSSSDELGEPPAAWTENVNPGLSRVVKPPAKEGGGPYIVAPGTENPLAQVLGVWIGGR